MNNKMIATILGVFVLAFMVTASPVMASEVSVSAENVETGADSDNENEVEIDMEGDVDLTNVGDVTNAASASANTGGNEQNMNTTGGDTESGDVEASTDWESVINDGFGLCGCPFGANEHEVEVDFMNKLTGYNSDNENELEIDDESDVTVTNVASILNSLGLSANTGDNDQNMNTTAGDLETGDVSVDAEISNWANVVNGNGGSSSKGLAVEVSASNEQTGADSDNENEVDIDLEGDTTLTNVASITNAVTVSANTGGNEQNQNTTAGSTKTGDVSVKTDVQNVANAGNCCPSGGTTTVEADLSNDTTGYNSDNENEVEIDDEGDTTVTNTASVTNSVAVEANTGDNEQNQNTTGGDVETGSVSIDFSSTTVVNSVE